MGVLSRAVEALIEVSDPNDWSVRNSKAEYEKLSRIFVHVPSGYTIEIHHRYSEVIVRVKGLKIGWWEGCKIRKSINRLLARQASEAMLKTSAEFKPT